MLFLFARMLLIRAFPCASLVDGTSPPKPALTPRGITLEDKYMRSSLWILAAAAAVAIVAFTPRAEAAAAPARDDAVSASRHHALTRHHWRPRTTTGFSGSRIYAPNNFNPAGSEAYDAQQGLGGKFGGR